VVVVLHVPVVFLFFGKWITVFFLFIGHGTCVLPLIWVCVVAPRSEAEVARWGVGSGCRYYGHGTCVLPLIWVVF
jgi:hypothetical protein